MQNRIATTIIMLLAGSTVGADDKWVTLKGRIVYDGTPPAVQEQNVTSDQVHCLEKGKILKDEWLVNKANNGVKNVFVWLAADGKTASGKALPIHPSLAAIAKPTVEMDQPRCAFEPHVVAVREGQTLVVKNSSTITHNTRWDPADTLANKAGNETIVAGKSINIANLKQHRLAINVACTIHPWMRGYIRVFDSPYFAVTDADGKFEIKLAPVGKHRLFVWHEGAGWKGGAAGKNGDEIEIKPGEVQDLGELKIKQ